MTATSGIGRVVGNEVPYDDSRIDLGPSLDEIRGTVLGRGFATSAPTVDNVNTHDHDNAPGTSHEPSPSPGMAYAPR